MDFLKKPFLLSFAGNPMRYHLTPSTGGGGTEETLSVVEITFTNIDTTEDHSVDITFMGVTRNFALKTTPTTEEHLPAATGDMEAADWAEAVYNYIINDGQLLANYKIELDGAKIILTALAGDAQYDWLAENSTITGLTITTTTNGSGGTGGTVEGVTMQVWNVTTNTKIAEEYKPVDSVGDVKFDVDEYIYAELLAAIPPRFRLTVPSSVYHIYTDYVLKYRTVFFDRISGTTGTRGYTDPDHPLGCYALPGGLNRDDLVANNATQLDYFSQAAVQKKFLTWSPASRITDRVESHSLFFCFQDPTWSAYKMKCMITTVDGDLAPVDLTAELITPNKFSVVEFLVGYVQAGLTNFTNKEILSWQVYLVDESNNVISDIREFVIDQRYHDRVRYFRFCNSWGVYDSLRCTGAFEKNLAHDREKVTYLEDAIETSFNAPGNLNIVKEMQSYKANTGWLTADHLEFLRDFMLSQSVYEVDETRLLKCLITSQKTALFKDRSYNYDLAFEYERGYDDFFFSRIRMTTSAIIKKNYSFEYSAEYS